MVVDRYLDANGGVDHAEQRRRQAAPRNAAPPAGAGEAGRVGEDAAADGEHRFGSAQRIDALELVEQEGERLERLPVLVARRDDGVEPQVNRLGPALQRLLVEPPHRVVDHHDDPACAELHLVLDERVSRREEVALLPDLLAHAAVERLPLRTVGCNVRDGGEERRGARGRRHLRHDHLGDSPAVEVRQQLELMRARRTAHCEAQRRHAVAVTGLLAQIDLRRAAVQQHRRKEAFHRPLTCVHLMVFHVYAAIVFK
mmetsp:Transcript_34552/g.75915  ORF Transcript_34552/g.75915 Transcript_34552/m.75915 type:complete len:256 (+) Transcript_34552:1467-2234(+)